MASKFVQEIDNVFFQSGVKMVDCYLTHWARRNGETEHDYVSGGIARCILEGIRSSDQIVNVVSQALGMPLETVAAALDSNGAAESTGIFFYGGQVTPGVEKTYYISRLLDDDEEQDDALIHYPYCATPPANL